jgi:hypothetical protein
MRGHGDVAPIVRGEGEPVHGLPRGHLPILVSSHVHPEMVGWPKESVVEEG